MDDWRIWLKNTVADETGRSYVYHVERFRGWLGRDLDGVTREELLAYAAGLRERWAPATVKGAVCALRSYYGFRFGERSPARGVPLPKLPQKKQRCPSAQDLLKVLAGCDTMTRKGRRDLGLLYVMLDTGLRASEICRLRCADVDLGARRLVVRVKGGDDGVGVFGIVTANALLGWLADRPAVARAGVDNLFVSVGGLTPGRALCRDGLRAVFRRLGTAAGLAGFSPHDLRRAFCVGMLRRGAPLELVRRAGRWSNFQIMQRYADDLSAADVAGYAVVDGLALTLKVLVPESSRPLDS